MGADRAAFRLSAKRPVHPTHMQWLKYCIRGQVRSYQTTCNPLKERDFVGADRAAFRLSANTVFQAMNIRRMCWPFRGQVRSH
ncbi:hypothetical protein [Pseudomonas viridiflava]|uniref:hypothetical protein n=2 Tax=Pseudomonas viridiflava TaxID=33069 RepID=UPI001F11C38D|nr:hypothetical protein [Pseudomonas viridiflava]